MSSREGTVLSSGGAIWKAEPPAASRRVGAYLIVASLGVAASSVLGPSSEAASGLIWLLAAVSGLSTLWSP
jgi:hypothetical protein